MATHSNYEVCNRNGRPVREFSKSTRCSRGCLVKFLRANVLSFTLICGVLCGIIVGTVLQTEKIQLTQMQIAFLRFPGDMFLSMMKLLLIPVVVSSLLTAMADIDIRSSGKIGVRAMLYYLITLILASLMGVMLVLTIQPGKAVRTKSNTAEVGLSEGGSPLYTFMDLVRNMIPDNMVEAAFVTKTTKEELVEVVDYAYQETDTFTSENFTGQSDNASTVIFERRLVVVRVAGVNMVGLVTMSMVIGAIVSYIGEPAKPVKEFFLAIRLIIFHLAGICMWFAPIGIAFLIAATFASLPNLAESLQDLLIFTLAHLAGLILHGFLVLPIIYLIIVRKNPYAFVRNVIPALLFALGSESSGMTLPVTIRCLEEKNKLDPRVVRLLATVGATINMDGVCLFFSMMTIFIAQLNDITFDAGQIVTSCLLAISVSIGVGCVPGAHLIYITIVPATLHLPTHQVGMLFAVDWLISRCRTCINVLGDCFGAGIVASLSAEELGVLKATDVEVPVTGKLLVEKEDTSEDV